MDQNQEASQEFITYVVRPIKNDPKQCYSFLISKLDFDDPISNFSDDDSEYRITPDGGKEQENSKGVSTYSRGPYRRYGIQTKQMALGKINQGLPAKDIAEEMKIPIKNIKRWIQTGAIRKKGGGRRVLDENMEQTLYLWCLQFTEKTGKRVSRKLIREQALKFSNQKDKFKASKGWTDKFVRKYNLIRNQKKVKLKMEDNSQ